MRFTWTLLLAAALPSLFAQTKKDNGADWPMFNRDLAGTRYSPLTQISVKNVAKLMPAWTYRLRSEIERNAAGSGGVAGYSDHAFLSGRTAANR